MKCLTKHRLAYLSIRTYERSNGDDVQFFITAEARTRADLVAAFVFTMEYDENFADAVKSAVIEFNGRQKFHPPAP